MKLKDKCTVADLIEALKQFDQDKTVYIYDPEFGDCEIAEVKEDKEGVALTCWTQV